jgi:hypothetical protein
MKLEAVKEPEIEIKETVGEAEEQGYLHGSKRREYNGNPYSAADQWDLCQAFSRGVKRAALEFDEKTTKEVGKIRIPEGPNSENCIEEPIITPDELTELKGQIMRDRDVIADLRNFRDRTLAERDSLMILVERINHGCKKKELDWDFFEQRTTLAIQSLRLKHSELKSDIQDSIIREGEMSFTAEGKIKDSWLIKGDGQNYMYVDELEYVNDTEVLNIN